MINEVDIQELVPLNKLVKQAILDVHGDYDRDQAKMTAWAVRAYKKLVKQSIRSNKRYSILNINKNLNNAYLPCDFKEELQVAVIDDCGLKNYLTPNPHIANLKVEDIPCENECDKGCDCYPKQLCVDLATTQIINKIRINDTDYDETVTSTLQPNGEYYVVTTTPYLNVAGNGVDYVTRKEYITTFDVADCGCIEKTERNNCRLENLCFDYFCCYCSGCATGDSYFGGYKIFPETNTIQFDRSMPYKKVYMEWVGVIPKSGNEYLVPEVAFECLINLTCFYSVKGKKGVAISERQWFWDMYRVELGNMGKLKMRISLDAIVHAALRVPTFDYINKYCVDSTLRNAAGTPASVSASSSSTDAVVPTPSLPSSGCNPAIITTNGQEMEGGTTYHNASLIGVPFRIFATAFNRAMLASEYTILPTGGFTVLTGVYGLQDEFDIFPKWCDANNDVIPITTVMGARKKVIKVDGVAGSPVHGAFTYQSNDLIGATVEDIIVNKTIETVVDGDFTFDTNTGTITRTNMWVGIGGWMDTAVINYIK